MAAAVMSEANGYSGHLKGCTTQRQGVVIAKRARGRISSACCLRGALDGWIFMMQRILLSAWAAWMFVVDCTASQPLRRVEPLEDHSGSSSSMDPAVSSNGSTPMPSPLVASREPTFRTELVHSPGSVSTIEVARVPAPVALSSYSIAAPVAAVTLLTTLVCATLAIAVYRRKRDQPQPQDTSRSIDLSELFLTSSSLRQLDICLAMAEPPLLEASDTSQGLFSTSRPPNSRKSSERSIPMLQSDIYDAEQSQTDSAILLGE